MRIVFCAVCSFFIAISAFAVEGPRSSHLPKRVLWAGYSILEAVSATVGIRGNSSEIPIGAGIEGTVSGPSLLKEEGAFQYPCPHDDYRIVGEYLGAMMGIDMLIFFNFVRGSIYTGVGWYSIYYDYITESNVTGWRYTHFSQSKEKIAYSGGIEFHLIPQSYNPYSPPVYLTIGLNSIRGIGFLIGTGF